MSDNDSEVDEEEDDDDSDNDLEIVSEQSGTAASTDAASGGTEAPVKMTKIMLTEEQEAVAKKFQSAASKIGKTRKLTLRQVSDSRGYALKNQGSKSMMDSFDLSDW